MEAVKPMVGINAASLSITIFSLLLISNQFYTNRNKSKKNKKGSPQNPNPNLNPKNPNHKRGLLAAIGNTPHIRINSLSDATGCEILAKAEFLNPGGSVKDRVAVKIIEEALASGELVEGGVVTEGSAGSTAISLATVAPAFGCKCHVVIPDDAAIDKSQILEALGATVERVRPVSITHKDHFVNIARRRASEATKLAAKQREANKMEANGTHVNGDTLHDAKGGFFADQFENLANFRAHYEGTGPEIWEQTGGNLHAFVAAAGKGSKHQMFRCAHRDLVCSIRLQEE